MASICPGSVRRDGLTQGHAVSFEDAAELFTPSMRGLVPGGVVGDPRGADALRGRRYLEFWVDALVGAYRDAKNRNQRTGMKNA